MIICAIDPGINNFAFGIENICVDTFKNTDCIDLKYLCSETIFFDNIRLETFSTKHLSDVLEKYHTLWEQCDVILVEKQMQFKNIINTKIIRIAHHCLSYFEIKYPNIKVIEYSSSNKTRVLKAPQGLTKPQRKKWSIDISNQILNNRFDTFSIEKRKNMNCKLDDVSDCMLMCLSYIIMNEKKL